MPKVVSNFVKSMFYDENRTFLSRTAMMNFVFFILTVMTILASVTLLILAVVFEWEVKAVSFITAFYTFLGAITGGGFLQYSYTKKLNADKEPCKGTTPQSAQDA